MNNEKIKNFKRQIMFVFAILLVLPLAFVLIGCGNHLPNIDVYNTKYMSDQEILQYFPQESLDSAKQSNLYSSVFMFEVDDTIPEENIYWDVVNQQGQVIITSYTETATLPDDLNPEETKKVACLMIIWESTDLGQSFTANLYYLNSDQNRVNLATGNIDVTAKDFMK